MVEQLATPQTCAVKDLSLGDQIEIRDFAGGPRVVRGGTKISADTMELKLEDADGHIEVADFKLNEEVAVIAKKAKSAKAAKEQTKKTSSAKHAGPAKSKDKTAPKTAVPTTRAAEPKKAAPERTTKMSAVDAAAKVLSEAGEAMNCQDMIKAMGEKGYWTSPGGKTPHATLYSAILREIQNKGNDARFKKMERGKFSLGKAS
jgi:HB1, ASXL, restriction endonuclease HTH domain